MCFLHHMDNFDDRPGFAIRLEKARKDRGFPTPKAASRYFGWKYETYIQHEQGVRGIGRASGKYAKAFRVSEAWLLTGEGEPEASDPEARLRSALLAYGVDKEDLGRAVSAVKVFVDHRNEQSSLDPPDDQSEPASPRRESEPSGRRSRQPSS